MGLLLGGSVLTVFELIDLIVFRFVNTLFAAKQKPDAEGDETAGTGATGDKVQSPRSPEHPVSAVSTINTPQRRIRRIAKYQPPTSPPSADDEKPPALSAAGGRPAIVVQTKGTATPGGNTVVTCKIKRLQKMS